MTQTSPDLEKQSRRVVPHRLWERLPQANQRAVVAILAVCLSRQVSDQKNHPTQREVQHEPPPRR